MAKSRNRKMVGTNVSLDMYRRLEEIAREQNVTLSLFVKHAITERCQQLGYNDINLLEETGDWGGKREGSGRPPKDDTDE